MIDTLIFDLGNVLAFHDNARLFAEMARLFSTTPDEMKVRLENGLWPRVNTGKLPGDALRLELISRLGKTVSPADWERVWNCHFTLNTPMVHFVETLVGRVRLVLLSNTHDSHFRFLRPLLPVLERFDGLTLSYEVGAVKPDPEIYRHALSHLKTPPERAVFFDDVPTFANAASSLGIHGRVFTSVEQCRADLRELGVAGL